MSRHYEDYESIARDIDDLYEYDEWDYDDAENVEHSEWENYYHNITDELEDE